jgi:alginate O-acetyltransferase complex protein AlgI
MDLTSPVFFLFAGLGLALYWALDRPAWRHGVLVGLNIAFIAGYFAAPLAAAPLVGFLLLGFAANQAVGRWPSGAALWAALAAIIGVFVYLKRYAFVDFPAPLPFAYSAIGLSYILFRIVHLAIDVRSGDLAAPLSPSQYLGYVLFFPSFVSGPIQRWQDFDAKGWAAPTPLADDTVFEAFSRIVTGLIKVALVSSALQGLFAAVSPPLLAAAALPLAKATALFIASAALYALFLYYNFAGYTDMVIGLARLFGVVLPENFNRPFRAANALDFWSRWHMSLSEWFKTYLFNPLLKALVERNSSAAAAPFLAVVSFFVTFLLIGIWHGSTVVFLYYGLFLGAGVSANKLYQVLMTKRLGKKAYQALARRPVYHQLCRGLTFAYFGAALTCFWVDAAQLDHLVARLGPIGLGAAFVLLTLSAAVATWLGDGLERVVSGISERLRMPGAMARDAWLGAKVFTLVALSTLFNTAPDFVYQAF